MGSATMQPRTSAPELTTAHQVNTPLATPVLIAQKNVLPVSMSSNAKLVQVASPTLALIASEIRINSFPLK